MVFSRPMPQQTGQISPATPGQKRRARFFWHTLQGEFTGGNLILNPATSLTPESYHGRTMNRADLYLKVELDLDDLEKPERIAAEICRMLRKVYGVRQVEVSSIVERDR
jgi:hypothetical protein